ncbi:hypothetical protein DFH08DRAFT_942666, partial [Mycena albidolilacea]
MPHQHNESYIVNMKGGEGGAGGVGGQQGGNGGVGEGPKLYLDADIIHIVIHRGGREEGIDITRREFLDWLSPLNFFPRQQDISRVREKGTGGWLLADPVFKKWESGSGSTLWCHGIRISMVVEHLGIQFTGKSIGVACIYLNHKEVDIQTPSRLLAGLWRQLVLDRDIGSIAENLYKQHREKCTTPSLEEVVDVLSSSLKEFSQVFIIVDAMDEYPEFQREILLQQLAAMGSNVNLMITSRPNISPGPSIFPNLETLDIRAAPEDIQGYIDAQIKLSPRLSRYIQKKPILQQEIHEKITETVDGMFLLAKLHIASLITKSSIGAVQDALKKLPKDLHESYDVAMQRIEAQDKEDQGIAHSTLIWVANAKRPLKVSEMEAALAIKPGDRSLNEDYLLDIETILAVCAGLVIVDEEYSVLRLVHYTTQQYLDSIQAQKFPNAQTEITRTLLTCLAFDGFPDSSWTDDWATVPPLVEYSQYCLAHAAGQPQVQLRESLLEFLAQGFQWKKTMNSMEYSREWKWKSLPWDYTDWPPQASALWIAAAANLVDSAKSLLEGAALPQHSGNQAILVASYYGHTEIVHILLDKGTDVNAARGIYGSCLQAATLGGHTEIVCILLDKGADVNAAGGEYGSSLQAAAKGGHTEIVCILLDKGADVNAVGGFYGSSLHAAAQGGHTEIVCILLDK